MTALTADVIVDRIRTICIGAPFELVEATRWDTFELQPTTNIDGVFRIPPPSSQYTTGMFGFVEDRVDTLQVWVARKHNQQWDDVRRRLLQDVHSLTTAIIRDAHQVSGDYTIHDEGRGHSIGGDDENRDAEYLTLRLTLPVNYEAQL